MRLTYFAVAIASAFIGYLALDTKLPAANAKQGKSMNRPREAVRQPVASTTSRSASTEECCGDDSACGVACGKGGSCCKKR